MATFHPVFPARRQASDANRMALTRCCLLTAKPSRWSRVGDDTPRQAAEISSADIPSVVTTAGLERSVTCFRSTCAKNVNRGSIAALTPANRRRYSRSATSQNRKSTDSRHVAGCSDLDALKSRDTSAGCLLETRVPRRTGPVAFASTVLEQPQGASRPRSLRRASTRAPGQHVLNEIGNDGDFPLSNHLEGSLTIQLLVRQVEPLAKIALTENRAYPSHSLKRL